VTVNRSTIADNHSDLDGGGIYTLMGEVVASNSTFTGNTADDSGGATMAIECSYTFVTMVGNSAADSGGAMATEEVTAFGRPPRPAARSRQHPDTRAEAALGSRRPTRSPVPVGSALVVNRLRARMWFSDRS
jgi:hypothetical protein